MDCKSRSYLIAKCLFVSIWLLLFAGGLGGFPGSTSVYIVFSLVSLSMVITAIYRQISYGYIFLVSSLWLGLWLKLTIHQIVGYPYDEPVGYFVATPAAWDKVLWIATVGCVGVVAARIFFGLTKLGSSMLELSGSCAAPPWYGAVRKKLWGTLIVICLALAIANASFGILRVGLVPATILSWPLNAVISWLIGNGLTLGIATLLWWDIAARRNISLVVYFVLLEAAVSTVSLLSRGAYIFHTIPQFLGIFKNRKIVLGWNRKNVAVVCAAFLALFAFTNPLVNTLRNYYYSNLPLPTLIVASPSVRDGGNFPGNVTPTVKEVPKVPDVIVDGRLKALAKFAVDRWIGIEGILAVSAYPDKSVNLLLHGITERAQIGKNSVYQDISLSPYRSADASKFQFATIPGAIGFLYFAGSLWLVFLGIFSLAMLALVSENLIFRVTYNPLLAALWGGIAANSIAQLGLAPRSLLIYFLEMLFGVLVIWFAQSRYFSRALAWVHTQPGLETGA